MFTDLLVSLSLIGIIGGLLGCFLYLSEKPKPKARGRKAAKLDCWL